MSEGASQINEWVLNQEAFEKLLQWLDPNRDQAGVIYETIRTRLMKFFQWQTCPLYEEYTDETLSRVIRKLSEGAEIQTSDPYLYFHGVARNVLREYWKKHESKTEALDDLPPATHPVFNPHEVEQANFERQELEHRLDCLEHCLQELPPESRELFLDYHSGEQRERINNRLAMAQRLNIPLNALRSRITRLNDKIEKCVLDCLKKQKTED